MAFHDRAVKRVGSSRGTYRPDVVIDGDPAAITDTRRVANNLSIPDARGDDTPIFRG